MTKKKKFILWGVGIIVVLGIIGNLTNDKTEEEAAKPALAATATATAPTQTAAPTAKPEPTKAAPTPKPSPKNGKEITSAEFLAIESGMTYEKVVEIIGSPGELVSEVGKKGEAGYTVMYMWEGNGFGANANAMFQDGKLMTKAQSGLK